MPVMNQYTFVHRIPYHDPLATYAKLRGRGPSFILESGSHDDAHVNAQGRFSLIGVQPSLALMLTPQACTVTLLRDFGRPFYDFIRREFSHLVQQENADTLQLQFARTPFAGDEALRFARHNAAQAVRALLRQFYNDEKNFLGLYGAFAYNFVFEFEDYEPVARPEEPTADARLYLFDTLLLYNHLTRECTLYCTQADEAAARNKAQQIVLGLEEPVPALHNPAIGAVTISPNEETFRQQVRQAVQLCEDGELLELVLSRKHTAPIAGDPLPIYHRYRSINPSPYLFYFDFEDEVLLGASPEMMLRVEGGRATLRPISGSSKRGVNAVEDHHNMLQLLTSGKEKSELDMLIDLGRNDLARICKPGIRVDDYRAIEKYSHVMHTVAQVSGELQDGLLAFDGLAATLNAGTLTGAPKAAAMRYIDQIETHARGYYGGAIGYVHFNNELNTGIVIRTAHVRGGHITYTAGATLLVESDPQAELDETKIKTGGFMQTIAPFLQTQTTPAHELAR
jgi:anthranilate synthase